MSLRLSDFPPSVVRIFIDGQRLEGQTKVAVDWPRGQTPWVSITTDPDDLTYLTPPLGDETFSPDDPSVRRTRRAIRRQK